ERSFLPSRRARCGGFTCPTCRMSRLTRGMHHTAKNRAAGDARAVNLLRRRRWALGDWLKRRFGGRRPAPEIVPFLDVASRRVVQIPPSELRPGMIQAQAQGREWC